MASAWFQGRQCQPIAPGCGVEKNVEAFTETVAQGGASRFISRDRKEIGYVRSVAGELPFQPRSNTPCLDYNSLDLVEAELVAPPIIELRRARRRMIRHRRCLFERAAVLEIGGDPGCPKTVIAELGCNAGRCGAPTKSSHRRSPAAALCASACRCRARSCGTAALWDRRAGRRRRDRRSVFFEVVVARHRVPLAALLAKPHP